MENLFFENKSSSIAPHNINGKTIFKNKFPLIFQHQVHKNRGLFVTEKNLETCKRCLTIESDYLITNLPHVYIGVLTADCLPIALHDTKNKAIGIIHAGWRGTVNKILLNAIEHMNKEFGTDLENLNVFFGPCAHPCCYDVDKPFVDQLPSWANRALKKNCFDLVKCNEILLQQIGLPSRNINKEKTSCTICNDQYCSHRRDPACKARQMNIICLQ
jgi:polyphenol oxidase